MDKKLIFFDLIKDKNCKYTNVKFKWNSYNFEDKEKIKVNKLHTF